MSENREMKRGIKKREERNQDKSQKEFRQKKRLIKAR